MNKLVEKLEEKIEKMYKYLNQDNDKNDFVRYQKEVVKAMIDIVEDENIKMYIPVDKNYEPLYLQNGTDFFLPLFTDKEYADNSYELRSVDLRRYFEEAADNKHVCGVALNCNNDNCFYFEGWTLMAVLLGNKVDSFNVYEENGDKLIDLND